MLECMPHVERTRDVGWRDCDREWIAVFGGCKVAGFLPFLVPGLFYILGFVFVGHVVVGFWDQSKITRTK